MKEYQLNHSETGVSYRRKHVSAHCILWPNELMSFLWGLYVLCSSYVTMVRNATIMYGRIANETSCTTDPACLNDKTSLYQG